MRPLALKSLVFVDEFRTVPPAVVKSVHAEDRLDSLLRSALTGPRQALPPTALWERIAVELEPPGPSRLARLWSYLWMPIKPPDMFSDHPWTLQWFATRGFVRVS